jgi:hypothetical protein
MIFVKTHDALLIMEEFYNQFHNDLFNYHISTIVELLNNLRWAIYEYLQPIYSQSTEFFWKELVASALAAASVLDVAGVVQARSYWSLLGSMSTSLRRLVRS